jgi:hypothetical protein
MLEPTLGHRDDKVERVNARNVAKRACYQIGRVTAINLEV